MHDQPAQITRREQQVGAKRDCLPADGDGAPIGAVATGEMPRFVELPVIRQVNFRDNAEQLTTVDGQGAVEQRAEMAQRRADQQQRHQVRGFGDDRHDGRFHRVQQRSLLQQVTDGIAGQSQLGKHRHGNSLIVACPRHVQYGACVGRRIRQRGPGRAGGDADETVTVDGSKAHGDPCTVLPSNMAWLAGSRHPAWKHRHSGTARIGS